MTNEDILWLIGVSATIVALLAIGVKCSTDRNAELAGRVTAIELHLGLTPP